MKDQLNESIVLDGAAARGDADQEPEAVARVRTPAFGLRLASMARSRGVLAGAATCTVGKPMCGLQAMPMAR